MRVARLRQCYLGLQARLCMFSQRSATLIFNCATMLQEKASICTVCACKDMVATVKPRKHCYVCHANGVMVYASWSAHDQRKTRLPCMLALLFFYAQISQEM